MLSLFVRFYRGARNEVHDAVGSVLGDESMRRLKLKAACTGLLDTLEHIEYVPLTLGRTTSPRCCGCGTGARGTTVRRSRRGREYVM